MGFSTALWEAISGTKWPYDEEKANQWASANEKFMNLFGGIKPGQGTINVSKTANPTAVASYYRNKGYNVTGFHGDNTGSGELKPATPSGYTKEGNPIFGGIFVGNKNYNYYQPQKKTASNKSWNQTIDELLTKAHGLHPNDLAPNANKWALNLFHQQLANLSENQRRYLADPNISDTEKVVRLKEWTGFKTLDDVNEYARRLKEEEGSGATAFGGWGGYQNFLHQVNENDPAKLRYSSWSPQWEENLKKYGLESTDADPILKDWYYFNQIWKHSPNDTRTEAYPYRRFQGDFEGFYKQRVKDLMAQGKIGQNFDLQKYLSGEKALSPLIGGFETGGAYPPSFRYTRGGMRYAGNGGRGVRRSGGAGMPVSPQSFQGTMTDILNLLQLADTYKPLDKSIQRLMNPEVAIQPYKERIGSLLNQMSRRGVINSTVLERELNKITQSWLDRARELQEKGILGAEELRKAAATQGLTARNLAANLALGKYQTDLNAWLRNKGLDLDEAYRRDVLGEQIRKALFDEAFKTTVYGNEWNRQRWLDTVGALKDITGIEEGDWKKEFGSYSMLDELLKKDRQMFLSGLYDLWHTMISGRYSVPSETRTESGGTSPFVSLLAPAIGQITGNIGEGLLNKGMDMIKGIFTPEGMGKLALSAATSFIAPGGSELLIPGFPGI